VPKSDVPGEETAPTQPLSSVGPGFRTLTADDIWGATPEDLAECRARFATLRYDGAFTPPSLRGSVMLPANIGGAHWGGVAYDSDRGIAIVPNNRLAAVVKLIPRAQWKEMREKLTVGERVGREFTDMQGTPYVMQRETWLSSHRSPCTAPPFGSLTAIDLKTGKTLWDVGLGTGEGLDKIGLPPLPAGSGMANLGGAITTARDHHGQRDRVHRRDARPVFPRVRRRDRARIVAIQTAGGRQGHADDVSRRGRPSIRRDLRGR
jgi:quinoprotein glucose dehydrogenase